MAELMAIDAAHRQWWQIFEVIFGIPFLTAIILQWIFPFSIPYGFLTPMLIPGGVVLVIIGMMLVILARRQFTQYSQPTDPGHPTSQIITTGVFSISRNPLYLGGISLLAGIAFILNLAWALILLLPTLVACNALLVAPEERYLTAKFGEEYQTYVATVHRWIGRARNERVSKLYQSTKKK